MEKYIIIDTWNGEGYTDSNVKLMGFNSVSEAESHCLAEAKGQADAMGTKCYAINGDDGKVIGYGYEDFDKENAGAYQFEKLNSNDVGIVLDPCVNGFEVFDSANDFGDAMDSAYRMADEEDQELIESLQEGNFHGQYIHGVGNDGGDAMFFKLDVLKSELIEWYDGGDGVEYEVWQDKITKQLFRVPIEIVRDFDEMEEVSSVYEAKFGR